MKALAFTDRLALENLRVVERAEPTPGPREVLIRMLAASLNYRDLVIARGAYGRFGLPLVPLSDGAGQVVAHGREVTRFRVGDLVCPVYVPDWLSGPAREETSVRRRGGSIDGVLSEYLCLDEGELVRAPSGYDARQAATLPVAAVSIYEALFAAPRPLGSGDTLAVQGSGGASLFAIQLAIAAGARVIALSRGSERQSRLQALGATFVDGSRVDYDAAVRAATGGAGVDCFVDVVGGALDRSIAATRFGGSVLMFGFVGGTEARFDLTAAIRRNVSLRTVSGGSRLSFEQLVGALEANRIVPHIDRVFRFDAAREAYDYLADSRPFGKVVIDIAGPNCSPWFVRRGIDTYLFAACR